MRVGPMPMPVAAPDAIGFDEVTNGYVPWSRSSSVACAPSKSTSLPSRSAWSTSSDTSPTNGASRSRVARRTAPRPPRGRTARPRRRARARRSSRRARPRSSGAGSSGRARPARGCRSATPCRRTPGPMPRRVVPICSLPSRRSDAWSIATCHGMIRCALPESDDDRRVDPARLELVELVERAPAGRRRSRRRSPRSCPR